MNTTITIEQAEDLANILSHYRKNCAIYDIQCTIPDNRFILENLQSKINYYADKLNTIQQLTGIVFVNFD